MELLSPAGSKESFVSAIEAGADAVYFGLQNFSARNEAKNLNFYDAEVLVNFAKNKNKKCFIAFNTLIKHDEISEAIKTIEFLQNLEVDGLIIQDLGLARILKEFYPNIPLHASTQMNIHNSLGAEFLANENFKRVVLSRELTFSEIKHIAKNVSKKIELEIFIHGALCFAVSGLCLFSSFLGGFSGNRGRCKQPCRRIWQDEKEKGYLFSPKDLELASFINEIKKINISSLKIEGRMKSPEYVYKVTKAYRILLDSNEKNFKESFIESKNILSNDFSRQKTTCLFSKKDKSLFETKISHLLGLEIGKLKNINLNEKSVILEINKTMEISKKDRIRFYSYISDKGLTIKINEIEFLNFIDEKNVYKIYGDFAIELFEVFNKKNKNKNFEDIYVFKLGDSSFIDIEKNIKKKIDNIYFSYQSKKTNVIYKNQYTNLISRIWKKDKDKQEKEKFWFRFNENFISFSSNFYKNIEKINGNIILSINKSNFNLFKNFFDNQENNFNLLKKDIKFLENSKNLKKLDKINKKFEKSNGVYNFNFDNFAIEFSPWIPERDSFNVYKDITLYFINLGFKKFIFNNLDMINFFNKYFFNEKEKLKLEFISGNFLYVWNGYAGRFLKDYNFSNFMMSWEYDFLSLKRLANSGIAENLIIPVFGFPIIVHSIMLDREENYSLIKSDDEKYKLLNILDDNQNLLLPEKPFMIFNFIPKLLDLNIKNFLLDFSFCEFNNENKCKNKNKIFGNNINFLEIMENLKNYKNLEYSTKFNFKMGII